jgi:hypothetical protein
MLCIYELKYYVSYIMLLCTFIYCLINVYYVLHYIRIWIIYFIITHKPLNKVTSLQIGGIL